MLCIQSGDISFTNIKRPIKKTQQQILVPVTFNKICLQHIYVIIAVLDNVYIYIYIYTHKSHQKVLSFPENLPFLHTSHLCMDLTCTEIKTEI